jgi:hypothetical protein
MKFRIQKQDDYIETSMGRIPIVEFDSKYFTKEDAVRVLDALKNGYALRDRNEQ